jgi:Transposase
MPRTGRHPARRVRLPPALRHVHLNAAGIDVGAGSHHVAIPPGRDPEGRDVREFGAFTADLSALAQWLRRCGIETVAMESTGVYWIPLFELLAARGFEVRLVDPRQLRNVPGRKSDVLDLSVDPAAPHLRALSRRVPAGRPDLCPAQLPPAARHAGDLRGAPRSARAEGARADERQTCPGRQ